jgi:hypothetical protein
MMVSRNTVEKLLAGGFNRSLGIDAETVERRTGRKVRVSGVDARPERVAFRDAPSVVQLDTSQSSL